MQTFWFVDDSSSGKFLPVFRVCFERFHEILISDNLLPNLPSLDRSTREFEAKFPDYFTSDEYCSFANQTARITKRYKDTSLSVLFFFSFLYSPQQFGLNKLCEFFKTWP